MVPALEKIIAESDRIVFFGGAGVSTESGIPDFRSVDGLYHQKYDYPPETILSHTFWEENPEEFYRFYRDKLIVKGAKPNAAHLRLAKLEREGKLKAIVTQNIDGLHQAAGSKTVYELHGSTLRNYCVKCGAFYDVDFIANSTGGYSHHRRHQSGSLPGGGAHPVLPWPPPGGHQHAAHRGRCAGRPVHCKAHRSGAERGRFVGGLR